MNVPPHLLLVVVVVVVITVVVPTSSALANTSLQDEDVEDHCVQTCRMQNHTDGHCDDACGGTALCEEGCTLWRPALDGSCQSVCQNGSTDGILSSKELYCIIGCNNAVTRYYFQLRFSLGTPPPPALVADSLTSTSLRLEWNFPRAQQAGLKYFLQWHYEEHAGDWQYCRNQSWGPQHTVAVDNLQPYTKYRFRVALILSNLTEPIVSPPSVVISTRPGGVPASPPSIVRAVPVDSTRISVSWEPGPFLHGPLLSYVLRITDNQPHGYSALKDLSAENNFYMLRNLMPEKNYTISISMRNEVGPGPSANVSISTPTEPKAAKDSEKLVLILGAHHVVIEQGTHMLDEPIILYNTNEFITGLAIYVSRCLLFVADSARYVRRMSLGNYATHSNIVPILSPWQINFIPLDLSMDWLNEHLYILGEVTHQAKVWQIARCDIDGGGLTVAVAGLRVKPHHIEVDPYNGYLFWVTTNGLYRLDLADISNGIKHDVKPELILAESNLGAFTIDHTNFSLLVADQNNNTVYSVSLDGKEVSNMRPQITTPRLQKVVSIASANKKFYWTDGVEVIYEEDHLLSNRSLYFHNSYPLQLSKSYTKVLVNLSSSQPVPVPVNPPTSVQAIFGRDIAKTTWLPPHLLGAQGKGTWQNWSYEISIRDLRTQEIRRIRDINSTSYTIRNLREDTEYVIKCAAYTDFGKGPWSTEFVGRTLRIKGGAGNHPVILWSAVDGLLKSDASGENVETVIHKTLMSDYDDIKDIAWYMDQLFLVTNTSQIVWYNMTSHKHGTLADIDSVGSISIDWIGKKLYWSSPKQKLIIRGNLLGGHQEPLPIVTSAKELNVDSLKAYMYWSTGHTVECAHLNGADRIIYHESQLFSGNLVMGLTLDMDHQDVYWIVRGSDGSNLYRAPMAGSKFITKPTSERISSLQKPSMRGPLCYFNNRLIWLQDDKSAVISDLKGKYAASISAESLSGLNMIYIMDSSQQITPNATKFSSMKGISVIPEQIERSSVQVSGSWDYFNITWKPVQRVNYGIVFYEIKVDTQLRNDSIFSTTYPSIKYMHRVKPYSLMHVSLRALTYWGASTLVKVKIHSPPSTPSAPKNPRAFVVHEHSSESINVTLRWDSPENPNGVLEGYKITWWSLSKKTAESLILEAGDKEYVFDNLLNSEFYYFQIQAFTNIGDGEISSTLEVDTSEESPIPTLLIATSDSIFIQDIDTKLNYSLLQGISTPMVIGYLLKERKIFWINDMQELLMFNLATLNRSKIFDINGKPIGLTIDWLERSLYYVQKDESNTFVYKLDLNHMEKGVVKSKQIFRTPKSIVKLEISPFTRKLYWIEEDSGMSVLMQINSDGSEMAPFFGNPLDECDCPNHPQIERTFTLDHSRPDKPSLIFINKYAKRVLAADRDGCKCEEVYAGIEEPVETIRGDFGSLYWKNRGRGGLLNSWRNDEVMVEQIDTNDVMIFGSHMQPYPKQDCLVPLLSKNLTVGLVNKTSHTLRLKMPEVEVKAECEDYSLAAVEFRVFYMPYNDENDLRCDETCTQEQTFEDSLEIGNLRSYSRYVFSVTLSNYYLSNASEFIGPGVVFQTAAGAPSPPSGVRVTVLNPTLLQLNWLPPQEINGDFVYYVIHWQYDGSHNGIRQKGEQTIMENDLQGSKSYTTFLRNLTPNETYSIWVRAYSENNETSSDSDVVQEKTYPEPENISLVSSTSSQLVVRWNVSSYIDKYQMQCALSTSNEWFDVSHDENSDLVTVGGLKAKTQYKFRLNLKYRNYAKDYVWPKDARFIFDTLGDRPSAPGIPVIQQVKEVYQVWWEASKENGAPIDLYMLEALKIPGYRSKRSTNKTAWFTSEDVPEFDWEPLYNGTDTFWKIVGLSESYRYAFRVSASNLYGWSELSEESTHFDPLASAQLAIRQDFTYVIIAVCAFVVVMVSCLVICTRMCCVGNKKDHQQQQHLQNQQQHIVARVRGSDMELATLRELPRFGNFVHNTNVLYISTHTAPEEVNLLPHIRREQITLKKFLGKGAFGEVYEGKAKGLFDNCSETKVAVKTLPKGASEQVKSEFLQEAHLMSHFKHEHILQLLGVCLDNDPNYIIMELMEGGDLLSYLHSSRKIGGPVASLNLMELLKMCIDVAKGCCYLEEMHFVHRDLACRNCLVSSNDPAERIVKVGDFGLARDIYKNDYYRKEGEGLMPVRWMAPESLVDGVFTCQSDVWAFGVLLWEIMTLGQKPYPARGNVEVLHYVRGGGRLGKPTDCPETLHSLMLSCWSYDPEGRPTFKFCLDELEKLYAQNMSSPMTGAHIGQYISTVPQRTSWRSNDDESLKEAAMTTPFLTPPSPSAVHSQQTNIPKYLELLYDGEDSVEVENDGYEVPRRTVEDRTACDNEVLVVNRNNDSSSLLKDVGYTNMSPDPPIQTRLDSS
ncbi:PREDICTED: proto-oncogene tyrosine-protein kinase ROS isoform X2 [Nicrophorus vespilloides]|uniref:Tyrosine-protein kinase receptor n=1 Tax=Nicrophorus vespilloides TaxID=110193 RepID=A0ABM1M381_NICVS|nr:PREDICTED: proto-oncogene tyrosine-protein kinase ROS isoform X2 [Nicrophorus vespilloides]